MNDALEPHPPLLVLEAARVDGAAGPLFEGTSMTLRGDRVGMLGAWDGMFGLMTGKLRLLSGRALLHGAPLETAVRRGALGVARAGLALPGGWSASEYLRTSARLSGLDRPRARRAAAAALAALGLETLATRSIGAFTRAERRALLIAHACVGDPAVIALERPFAGLDEGSAQAVAAIIVRATSGRSLLLSSSGLAVTGVERSTFEALDSVVTLGAGGQVQAAWLSAGLEGTELVLSVTRRAPELAAALTARGCQVTGEAPGEASEPVSRGVARLRIRLGETVTPEDVLTAALALEAPVLELRPDPART